MQQQTIFGDVTSGYTNSPEFIRVADSPQYDPRFQLAAACCQLAPSSYRKPMRNSRYYGRFGDVTLSSTTSPLTITTIDSRVSFPDVAVTPITRKIRWPNLGISLALLARPTDGQRAHNASPEKKSIVLASTTSTTATASREHCAFFFADHTPLSTTVALFQQNDRQKMLSSCCVSLQCLTNKRQ